MLPAARLVVCDWIKLQRGGSNLIPWTLGELSNEELLEALNAAKRKLPQYAADPQKRLAVWQEEIGPLTDELLRRYPITDHRPPDSDGD